MHFTRAFNLSLALLIGIGVGTLLGDPILGLSLGFFLTVGMGVLLWHRVQRHTGRRQTHELLLCQVQAARAIREGQVTCCWGCKRAVRRDARRCLYCGMQRQDAPLR